MRPLAELARHRAIEWETNLLRAGGIAGTGKGIGSDSGGCFILPSPVAAVELRCIVGIGEGWDHISVTVSQPRCPRWAEMDYVKRIFFRDDETAFQLHVPTADHISVHPYCLHLWRPHGVKIPRPPSWMVG